VMQSSSRAVPQSDSSTVCEWFARCTNPATLTLPHPVLPLGRADLGLHLDSRGGRHNA